MGQFRSFFSDALAFASERRGRLSFVLRVGRRGVRSCQRRVAVVQRPRWQTPVPSFRWPLWSVERRPSHSSSRGSARSALGATVFLILRTPEPRPRVVRLVAILFAGAACSFPTPSWCGARPLRLGRPGSSHSTQASYGAAETSGGQARTRAFDWKAPPLRRRHPR